MVKSSRFSYLEPLFDQHKYQEKIQRVQFFVDIGRYLALLGKDVDGKVDKDFYRNKYKFSELSLSNKNENHLLLYLLTFGYDDLDLSKIRLNSFLKRSELVVIVNRLQKWLSVNLKE